MENMKKDSYESYLDLDFKDITPYFLSINRRDFLKLTGGIVVFFTLGGPLAIAQEGRRQGQGLPGDFNAYLRIGEDGRVTCFTGKIEMGQGIVTSLAQMLADELDVALESVEMVMGDTDLCLRDMGTFGSMSTRFFGPPLRAAGAEARRALLGLASEHLKVPVGRLRKAPIRIYDHRETCHTDRCSRQSDWQGKIYRRYSATGYVLRQNSQASCSWGEISICG
jgi:isoquinoline 1-oxidoreductase